MRRLRISSADGLALTVVADEHISCTVTSGEGEGHNVTVTVGEGEDCSDEAGLDTELEGVTVGVVTGTDGLGVGSQSVSSTVCACTMEGYRDNLTARVSIHLCHSCYDSHYIHHTPYNTYYMYMYSTSVSSPSITAFLLCKSFPRISTTPS